MKAPHLASLVVALGGCASAPPAVPADPPLRDLHAIPWAPARDGALADERAGLDAVIAIYRAWGFEEPIELALAESVTIPYADAPSIYTWRFLGDGPAPRAHIDDLSRALYGGRLDGWQARLGGPAEASRALQGFMTAMLGHEAAHVVGHGRGVGAYLTDPWLEETRAIHFEWAALRELIARRVVPPETFERAVAVNRALLDAAPPGLVAQLPKDEPARRERFNAGYYFLAENKVAGHEADVDAVLALYTMVRLELAAAPPEPLPELLARLAPPAPNPRPMATAALAFLRDGGLPFVSVDEATLTGMMSPADEQGSAMALALVPTEPSTNVEPSIVLEARMQLGEPIAVKRRTPLAVLFGRANAERADVVCDVAPDARAIRCRTVVPGTSKDLDAALRRGLERAFAFFMRWGDALGAVADRGADPLTVKPAEPEEVKP